MQNFTLYWIFPHWPLVSSMKLKISENKSFRGFSLRHGCGRRPCVATSEAELSSEEIRLLSRPICWRCVRVRSEVRCEEAQGYQCLICTCPAAPIPSLNSTHIAQSHRILRINPTGPRHRMKKKSDYGQNLLADKLSRIMMPRR